MRETNDLRADALITEKAEPGNKAKVVRASRNKSEKDRRDKVNAFINELATLVPGCSPPSKKLDKATILKNTVDFMKVHNDLTVAITHKDTTSCLSSNELGQLMVEGHHAFLFVISLSGSFKFFSESVHDLLGYMKICVDLLNSISKKDEIKDELIEDNIFDYVYPEDQIILKRQISQDIKTGNARNSGTSSFCIRFKAKDDERQFYETLYCCGNFRTVKQEVKSSSDGSTVFNANETCYVVLAKLVQPSFLRDVTKWPNSDIEFTSRQSLDGKFLYLDPRCIPITGYLPYEILGSVMYEYVHFDDLENLSTSFEAVLEDGEGESGDYRFLTKGSQWIVIKTSSYISYNHWNSKPEFICSTHQLVRSTISLRNNQTQDTVANKANSTALSSPHEVSSQVSPYYTTQKIVSLQRTTSDISQTASHQNDQTFPATCQNARSESSSKNTNSIYNLQQSNKATFELLTSSAPIQFDPRSAGPTTFWSGQNTSEHGGVNNRFQNPLVIPPGSPQQNIEVFNPSSGSSGSERTDLQSPRTLQGYIEPRAQISNARDMWQIAARFQTSPDNSSEFSQPNYQMPHGHYSPSPVASERDFQPSIERLNNFLPATSNLPRSSLHSGNYSKSPTAVHVMSPQVAAELRQPLSPTGYPATPTRMINPSVQSPPPVLSHSPQHYKTDGYSSSSLSPTSPQQRLFKSYPVRSPVHSPQVPDKYPQSPSFTSVSPHPPSPHSTPHTLENSSQPPIYPALSPAPVCRQSPPRAQLVSNRTNELHPPMSPYSASLNERHNLAGGYPPPSPCDFPVRSPRALTPPTESRHQQFCVSPSLIPQNVVNHPRSPEGNPVRSPVSDGHSTPRLSPVVLHNTTQFSTQSNQQHMGGGYYHAQFKKPAEEALQPCQINSGITRRSAMSTFPGEMLGTNDQSPEHVANNMDARRHTLEMFSSPRNAEGVPLCFSSDSNRTQNIDCESKTSEQQDFTNKQYLYEREYERTPEQTVTTRLQNSAVNSAMLTKSSTHLRAQIILQNQLLEKQNHLQNVILEQKAQLSRIQEQIILNAQAQFSLHEVGSLESTKALQQQVYDLEIERKQHETRQKALRSVFLQKLNGLTARNNDGEVQNSSPIAYSQNVFQHSTNTANSSNNFENSGSNPGFAPTSKVCANASRNDLKTRVESPGGSGEFADKHFPQGARQTNLRRGLEEDLFSGVLAPETRQSSDQCYTHTPHTPPPPPVSPHFKTSTFPLQPTNNDTTFSGRQNSSSCTLQTGECASSSNNPGNDYFSKFTASELETFLSSSSIPSSSSFRSSTSTQSGTPDDGAKEEEKAPSTYDSLLLQQKRLLEMQEEQRRQLVRRQQEQLLRLQQQQEQQQRMLVGLQHTSENTPQEHGYQISTTSGGGMGEDPSSLLSQELDNEDLNVVNMLLAEGGGTELWTNQLFDELS